MIKNILIVCIGNICRSPTAQKLMSDTLRSLAINVSSAGLAACRDRPMAFTARALMEEHGHRYLEHSACQLTTQAIHQADLILVMEKQHINAVLALTPEARGKVFLLGRWQDDQEITDPYNLGRAAFVQAYALIEEAVSAWAQRLSR